MTRSPIKRRSRFFTVFALVAVAATFAGTAPSSGWAHSVGPTEAIARLRAEPVRKRFDIVSVERSKDLPRLLIVRVGPAWDAVPASERAERAESWLHLWQAGVNNGVLAIVDDATEKSVLTFDAHGKAQMRARLPAPTNANPGIPQEAKDDAGL